MRPLATIALFILTAALESWTAYPIFAVMAAAVVLDTRPQDVIRRVGR